MGLSERYIQALEVIIGKEYNSRNLGLTSFIDCLKWTINLWQKKFLITTRVIQSNRRNSIVTDKKDVILDFLDTNEWI